MTVDVEIWDFENREVVECIVTRIENEDLTSDQINEIKNALVEAKEYLPEEPRDFEDFVHQMEREDFETLFELMKNSWQNLV